MTTAIEWTDTVWNPVTGCTKVSPGCKHCYAERLWPKVEGARVKREGGTPRAFTDVQTHPQRLAMPGRWNRPRRVFVNSMSDLFHEDVPLAFLLDVWTVMAAEPLHTFQILTKRPERMRDFVKDVRSLPNVWLGVSVENQDTANERVPFLMDTPAAVRFISYEPALGPVDLCEAACDRPLTTPSRRVIDWVIAGGESGPGARPAHPDWFRSMRDQCRVNQIAFFFKQWGNWIDEKQMDGNDNIADTHRRAIKVKALHDWPNRADGVPMWSVNIGKGKAGRLLDGRTWDEYPDTPGGAPRP